MDTVEIFSFAASGATATFLFLQTRSLTQSIKYQCYQHLMFSQAEVDKLLLNYPEVRSCIFENKDLPDSGTDIGQRVRLIVDLYLQFIEEICEHFNLVPKNSRLHLLQNARGFTKRPAVVQFHLESPTWHPTATSSEIEKLLAKIRD